MDQGVVAAQGDGLAAAEALHQGADELADAGVIHPRDLRQVDHDGVVAGGIIAKFLQRALGGRGDLASQRQHLDFALGIVLILVVGFSVWAALQPRSRAAIALAGPQE